MWNYEKRLQFPVNIKETNPTLASQIIDGFGGTDGELGASMRYLAQRYTMPYKEVQAILTDIGTEELAHIEMISAIVYQLTEKADLEDIENTPFAGYYVAHTKGLYPVSSGGIPFSATGFQSKGDPIADMHEDMAAEQKARVSYDNLLRLSKGTCAYEPLKFLREREIVHYQRFGEALRIVQDHLDARNFYSFNPEFDVPGMNKCNNNAGGRPGCKRQNNSQGRCPCNQPQPRANMNNSGCTCHKNADCPCSQPQPRSNMNNSGCYQNTDCPCS